MEIMHVADGGGGTDWEAELNRLASMETETELPYAQAISDALLDISNVLRGVTADGIEGDTGDAAQAAFHSDANDAVQLSDDVAQLIANLRAMNDDRRAVAHEHLDALNNYPEALSWEDEQCLSVAEVGSTWELGPVTFTVIDGIVGLLNTYIRAQRQARAQAGVKAVADRMDYWAQQFNTQARFTTRTDQNHGTESSTGGGDFTGGTGPATGGGDGSFNMYPGSGHNPAGNVPPGITYTPPTDPGTGDETSPTLPTFPVTPLPDYPDDEVHVGWPLPARPTLPSDNVNSLPALPDYPTHPWNPDDPTWNNPDAPWTPGEPGAWEPTRPTYPDDDLYTPYVPGENSGSDYQPYTPHPPYDPQTSNPATSNPTRPYIPGTDGGQDRPGLTPDSAMGNGSHGWGTGTSVGRGTGLGVGSTSGLLSSGGTGIGGASAGGGIGGAGSAGLIGGAGGAVSLAGAKLMQTGLNGSPGTTALAAAPGTAAAGARSGGGMGMMSGGAGGGQSTGSKSRRGLSGLVAPHWEDDDEPLPRSEAAGAGGRD